jgi:hypothetical protein
VSEVAPESLDYALVVAEYFLGLRGAGLLLSPLDQELVSEWERRGLPASVVCRGLRHGVEHLAAEGAPRPPRSLRALRGFVEEEWRGYRSGRVGEAPAPPGEAEAALRRLEAARERLAEAGRGAAAERREAYRAAWRALEAAEAYPGSPLQRAGAAIADADARLLATWLRGLPRPERAALGARVRLLTGARHRGTSRRAHRETLRAHLLDLALAAGLTPLRGSV